jgi:hypothetical protein
MKATASGRSGADPRGQIEAWWFDLPQPLRARAWPAALACLVIVALLLGFYQVVQHSVQQGELLRMSAATRAEAVWRCNALQGVRVREGCLEQLNSPPPNQAVPAQPPNTAVASPERVAQLAR